MSSGDVASELFQPNEKPLFSSPDVATEEGNRVCIPRPQRKKGAFIFIFAKLCVPWETVSLSHIIIKSKMSCMGSFSEAPMPLG